MVQKQEPKYLFEVLVPTIYGDTEKPISTKHHKEWDKVIRGIIGGLTIFPVAKGQWIDKGLDCNCAQKEFEDGYHSSTCHALEEELIMERIIPVRLACDPKDIEKVVEFTLAHYRQKAVMYYLLSRECFIVSQEV